MLLWLCLLEPRDSWTIWKDFVEEGLFRNAVSDTAYVMSDGGLGGPEESRQLALSVSLRRGLRNRASTGKAGDAFQKVKQGRTGRAKQNGQSGETY